MGGGTLDNNNKNIPMMSQPTPQQPSLTLYQELIEQSKAREQYHKRSSYNPFLQQQPSWSTSQQATNSIASVYPSYDVNEFQLDPVPLTTTGQQQNGKAPELPPVPAAYRNSNRPSPPSPIEQEIHSPIPTNTTTTNKVRLIYTKSGFYLKRQEDNSSIHGFLAIFSKSMENMDILIAWIPEYLIEPHDIPLFIELDSQLASEQGFPSIDLNPGQAETMTIRLEQIYSLYICPPSLQNQGSIVITSRAGDVFQPIWYASSSGKPNLEEDKRTWPGYNVIDILSAFVPLQNSPLTQNVHLVKDNGKATTATESQGSIVKALSEVRWTLLERLSRITQYTQDTATSVLQNPTLSTFFGSSTIANEYQMASQYLAKYGSSSVSSSSDDDEYHLMDDTDGLLQDMPELGGPTPIHTRRSPISPEEWITCFDQEGKLAIPESQINQIIFQGGLDSDIRIEAWKFLLGIYPWHSNFDEREAIRRSRAEAYYAIKSKWFDDMEIRNTKHFQDEKHRIDKDVHRTDRDQEAFLGDELPNPDPLMAVGTNANLEIMKDILVTYNFQNTDLGYVQGMSDLLAPLFVAMGDEAMAFWGFTLFMERVESNFYMDQSGMHGQLKTLDALVRFMDPVLYKRLEETETNNFFFCFRWLLVWFKREFEWQHVIRLWEVLWTNHLSEKFILFVALAIMDAHRKKILEDLTQFDEVLRYVNDLTGHIPLETTLERAEVLFYQFERKIRAMQHKKKMFQDQLQIRSVWNGPERLKIQDSIEKLKIPDILLTLLPSSV